MGFDPEKYLKKEAKSGFNPDAYIAEPQGDRFLGEGLLRGTLQALPAAGALVGGVVGSGIGPAGTFGGGVLGAGAGRSIQNIGESLLGDEKTRQEVYMGPVKEMAVESAGGAIAKGAGRLSELVSKYSKEPIENLLARFSAPEKAGAGALKAAAARLGTAPTRGMLTDERFVQKIESGLSQTPSVAGQIKSDEYKKITEALQKGAKESLAEGISPKTALQFGSEAKALTEAQISKRLEPAIDIYKKIENEVLNVDVAPVSINRISKNITNLPFAKISGSPESAYAANIADNLTKVKTLDELRNLRSYAGKAFNAKDMSPSMKQTAAEVYGRLSRLEQNSITRAALEAAQNPNFGNSVAKEMIGEIKEANKIYSGVSKDLSELASNSGMGKVNNYQDFIRKMADMPDERFVDSVFRLDNVKHLKAFQSQFPESFEVMRKAKMADIYNSSLTKGEISIPKLINNAKRIGPEARELLFGKDSDNKLRDIETVYNSFYPKVGPSGTPEGREFVAFNPFSPTAWYRELVANSKKYILDNPEKFEKYRSIEFDRISKKLPKNELDALAEEVSSKLKFSTAPRGVGKAIDGDQNETAAKRRLQDLRGGQ